MPRKITVDEVKISLKRENPKRCDPKLKVRSKRVIFAARGKPKLKIFWPTRTVTKNGGSRKTSRNPPGRDGDFGRKGGEGRRNNPCTEHTVHPQDPAEKDNICRRKDILTCLENERCVPHGSRCRHAQALQEPLRAPHGSRTNRWDPEEPQRDKPPRPHPCDPDGLKVPTRWRAPFRTSQRQRTLAPSCVAKMHFTLNAR